MKVWISFAQWYAMTPEQRQEFRDQTRGQFVLDLSCPVSPQKAFQSDKDEYLDDMGLGGQIYRDR